MILNTALSSQMSKIYLILPINSFQIVCYINKYVIDQCTNKAEIAEY